MTTAAIKPVIGPTTQTPTTEAQEQEKQAINNDKKNISPFGAFGLGFNPMFDCTYGYMYDGFSLNTSYEDPLLNYTTGMMNPFMMGGMNPFMMSGNPDESMYNVINTKKCETFEDFQQFSIESLAIREAAKNLIRVIKNDQTSLIPKYFDAFKKACEQEEAYKLAKTDEAKLAYIRQRFSNINNGKGLDDLIIENANCNFSTGFLNGLTFGNYRGKSESQLRAEYLNEDESRKERAARDAGTLTAATLGGGSIGAGAGVTIAKTLNKNAKKFGTIGAITAILCSYFINKATEKK